MDRLQAMMVFTRVVDSGSFARAAQSLDLARPSVTVIVQNLESFLKVRLLQRSTRSLNLTPEGAQYYQRCVRILAEVEETEAAFMSMSQGPSGKLRIDTPGPIGKLIIIPALDDFARRYPNIELTIGFGDRPVDLIQDGVDCVIRLGSMVNSTLIARRIGALARVTAASPEYLERFGTPSNLDDLRRHQGVRYLCSGLARTPDVAFLVEGRSVEVNLAPSITVNDAEAYLACGVKGLGIVQSARFMALPHLRTGELREILPSWQPNPVAVSAVYPQNRHMSRTVRAFVDWITERFASSPLFSGESREHRSILAALRLPVEDEVTS
jgi:LysR family transcriptional regulator, regulator for bpeEF and oprC